MPECQSLVITCGLNTNTACSFKKSFTFSGVSASFPNICNFFRSAVVTTQKTVIPLSSSVNTIAMGSQSGLSSNDVLSLNKAYSCAGRVATNGGGNSQVYNYY